MGRAHVIHHHPLPLSDWRHEHHLLVSFSMGLIIAMLATAIAAPTASMVRAAIAEHTEPRVVAADVKPAAVLPREWSWSIEPISFDHMYRQSESHAVADYTRDLTSTYYNTSRGDR